MPSARLRDVRRRGNGLSGQSMRLARIDDAAENQFLADFAFAGLANAVATWPWFGASDIATPVQWAFVDGTVFWSGRNNGSAVGGLYTNWASASPSDGSGTYCATLSHGSSLNWVDRTCSGLQPYLCEVLTTLFQSVQQTVVGCVPRPRFLPTWRWIGLLRERRALTLPQLKKGRCTAMIWYELKTDLATVSTELANAW